MHPTRVAIPTLILFAAFLTGCNIASGEHARAVQNTGGANKAAGEQQDIPFETSQAQLREELRLANERAKLAEDRAALEKEKREFAEERLRILQSDEAGDTEAVSQSSNQTYSPPPQRTEDATFHHPRNNPPAGFLMTWTSSCPLPEIGEIIECDNGTEYEVIGRRGNVLRVVELESN